MSHDVNITRIKGVYHALCELQDSVAFVGGATVSLYMDNPEQSDVRPTNDVDVLIEIYSYADYAAIQEKLTRMKFEVDSNSTIICRYKYQGLTVDIMPTDDAVLGFSNKWYKDGYARMVKFRIDEQTTINIFDCPYFIASKIEAFKGRGKNDGRTSQDFEDIVSVLDNRSGIWQEFESSDKLVRNYLALEIIGFLKNPHLEEWIACHLEPKTSTARAKSIIGAMKMFSLK